MNICIVCSRLCYGGAERVAVMWANGFAERGNSVILASNLNEDITYSTNGHVKLHNLFYKNKTGVKKWLKATRQLRLLVKKHKPDVVIGVMSSCSFIVRLATIGTGIKVVATEHNSFERPESAPMTKYSRFTKFIVNKVFSGVTVLTEADKRVIDNNLKNVFVLPNPLAIAPQPRVTSKERIVFAAGRLDDWHYKGFDLLIRAWGLINRQLVINNGQFTIDNGQNDLQCSKLTGWRLQIAGKGSKESLEYLKQLCKENGVEDTVDFLGFRTDIEELYRRSEIFVLSSRYEGFGLVLIEAMSQGCACVACDYHGRQREIITDDSMGLCCEPDNVEALAEGIKKMMEDEEYRKSVQLKAIERSKFYSIDNIMDRWETLLTQIVNE